jgi:hypothetical protein
MIDRKALFQTLAAALAFFVIFSAGLWALCRVVFGV